MKWVAAIAMLALSSCELLGANAEVAPEFRELYSRFLTDAARFNVEIDGNLKGLVIRMGSPEEFAQDDAPRGFCSNHQIVFNPVVWKALRTNDPARELLFYHEMGHCVLGQNHRCDVVSIMNTNLRAYWYAQSANREAMKAELFKYNGNGMNTCSKATIE